MAIFYPAKLFLNEQEIRYAMSMTQSNREAADFLRVQLNTYKKYAKQFFDPLTGKDLYESHKNQSGKFIRRRPHNLAKIDDIENGKHPNYSVHKLKQRLIDEGVFPDMCSKCNYHQLRSSDLNSPTILVFKNGDQLDRRIENMEIVCLNCCFLHYSDVEWLFRQKKIKKTNGNKTQH